MSEYQRPPRANIEWRRHGVLGKLFSLDATCSRQSIDMTFQWSLSFIEKHYGRQLYETDKHVIASMRSSHLGNTSSSVKLLFVIATLARELSHYEELIEEYQIWLQHKIAKRGISTTAGKQYELPDAASMISDLTSFQVVLCIVIRSIFELGNTASNTRNIIDNALLTCSLVWTSFDTAAMQTFIDRHTKTPIDCVASK